MKMATIERTKTKSSVCICL